MHYTTGPVNIYFDCPPLCHVICIELYSDLVRVGLSIRLDGAAASFEQISLYGFIFFFHTIIADT